MEMTVNEVRLRCTSMAAHNEMEGLNEVVIVFSSANKMVSGTAEQGR